MDRAADWKEGSWARPSLGVDPLQELPSLLLCSHKQVHSNSSKSCTSESKEVVLWMESREAWLMPVVGWREERQILGKGTWSLLSSPALAQPPGWVAPAVPAFPGAPSHFQGSPNDRVREKKLPLFQHTRGGVHSSLGSTHPGEQDQEKQKSCMAGQGWGMKHISSSSKLQSHAGEPSGDCYGPSCKGHTYPLCLQDCIFLPVAIGVMEGSHQLLIHPRDGFKRHLFTGSGSRSQMDAGQGE